ncbi:MAG TPA: thiamine pyrophosphate-binding protein, partial [Gammaproteobacteria bacterium]
MTKETDQRLPLDRRGFLKGAATGAAAMVVSVPSADAQAPSRAPNGTVAAAAPTAEQLARDAGNVRPPAVAGRAVKRPGSDLMTQVLKDLGVEYVAGNPGSSFEGLQESIVNYGDPPNAMPEFITALHEESSVDMANGYGKAEG